LDKSNKTVATGEEEAAHKLSELKAQHDSPSFVERSTGKSSSASQLFFLHCHSVLCCDHFKLTRRAHAMRQLRECAWLGCRFHLVLRFIKFLLSMPPALPCRMKAQIHPTNPTEELPSSFCVSIRVRASISFCRFSVCHSFSN